MCARAVRDSSQQRGNTAAVREKKVKNALILTQRVVFHNVHLCMTAATWHSVGIYARNTGSARIHRAQASLLLLRAEETRARTRNKNRSTDVRYLCKVR